VCDGLEYGEGGRYFIRINLATSMSQMLKGLALLRDFVNTL
jgi:bifunctional pyridoxal-dependent enzyme with beta-cystathionase and maltose regulon repressor activities